ncbi:hypothetical protein F7725_002748 [Dissostichus mawsoni]|uniref:Transposase n=1 Tax=Dissostichus mawsoni TaxID=36200 RepID=A0A7J5Y8G4_DISMA|nr:hypothetical protein F7725_002748 [Dissostichus mawsoni]
MKKVISTRDLTFQGQRIQIFRDLPTEVVKRRAAFTPTRKILRDKPGVRFGLLYPAKLRTYFEFGDKPHKLLARQLRKRESDRAIHRIWRQITKQLKLRALSFNVPLSSNPSFTPSIMDGTFDRWRELGMGSVGDLYIRGTFASFQQLQEKYGLARADFFKYLQIRHFVRTHLHDFETATPDKLDHCLRDCLAERHTVSFIYDVLQDYGQVDTNCIKKDWEKEFGEEIAEDTWDKALKYVSICSLNARHCLIQFNILHRLHYSKDFSNRQDGVLAAIAGMRKEVGECMERVNNAELRISGTEDTIIHLQAKVQSLESKNKVMEDKVIDLEARSRSSNLRLWIPEALDIPSLNSKLTLVCAHRIGQRSDPNAPPRTLIMKFLNDRDKMTVLKAVRAKKQLLYKDRPEKRDEAPATAVASIPSLVKLLEEHRDALSKEFKSAMTYLEAKLDFVQETVTDHGNRLTSLEANANQLSDKMEELEAKCAAMEGSYNKLKAKAIDLESHSPRNNIRITGLPESIEVHVPQTFFRDCWWSFWLDRAHRALTAKPSPGSRPRAVIARIHHFRTKELIIQEARKRRGKLLFQGKPVAIFEDYCPRSWSNAWRTGR